MKRPIAVIVILLFIALLGFTVLNRGVLPKADFTYAIADTIKTLDPAHTAWNEDIRMALALWEGLGELSSKNHQGNLRRGSYSTEDKCRPDDLHVRDKTRREMVERRSGNGE